MTFKIKVCNNICRFPVTVLVSVFVLIAISQSALGQNAPAKKNRPKQDKTVAEVLEVLPSSATGVLISAKHGVNYPSEAQQVLFDPAIGSSSADAKVRVTAKAKGAKNQWVYFEVIDPDDPSSYPEDTTPTTEWSQSAASHNISLEATPNTDPNDNRDDGKSGTSAYATFQGNCLPTNKVQLGSTNSRRLTDGSWEVWATLHITNRFAGDNYRVRATGTQPKPNTYFDQQTELNNKYKTSGLFTAWKRVYYEMDTMYRAGSYLSADAAASQNQVAIGNVGDFTQGDQVSVFDSTRDQRNTYTITNINTTTNTLTLSANLPFAVRVADGGYVGRHTGTVFYVPDLSRLADTFADCYAELLPKFDGSAGVPLENFANYTEPQQFRNRWFKNQGKSNYIYVVGAYRNYTGTGSHGWTWPQVGWNVSYIFVDAIETHYGATNHPAANRDATNHEWIHQFQSASEIGSHDHEAAHDGSDRCLMDEPHRNRTDDRLEAGLSTTVDDTPPTDPTYHVYKIRDWEDNL